MSSPAADGAGNVLRPAAFGGPERSAPAPRPSSRHAAPALILDLQAKRLGGRPILGALRLTVAADETVAITGPSGIGKTTLLRILAGLDERFAGSCVRPAPQAMVFQSPTLLPWRTAAQNLRLTTGIDAAAADRALVEVGLAGLGGRYPGQLSLGQQRRLALARAFAVRPALLLMDEPFVSLDAEVAAEMHALFHDLRRKCPVACILVTHDMGEAAALSDRMLRLTGSPARLAPAEPE